VVVSVVVFSLVVAVLVVRYIVRRRRRRLADTVYIPTYPTIELEQPYGGWDPDPSDAYTDHGAPLLPLITRVGPPSKWGRLP
jgi:hypothetical protein